MFTDDELEGLHKRIIEVIHAFGTQKNIEIDLAQLKALLARLSAAEVALLKHTTEAPIEPDCFPSCEYFNEWLTAAGKDAK